MAGFVRFGCGNCGSKMKVPAAFAGKRVKCPGCQQAAQVPVGREAGAEDSELSAMDLSMLDDGDAGGDAGKPRRIRDMVLGCGACGKNVKIPENRCGSVVRCPKCDTPLRVDCPPPPPGSGKTVDFRHVTLDPVNEASLSGSDGSLAGSLAGLTTAGSASGGAAGGASGAFDLNLESLSGGSTAGAGAGATSGRDQMAELRTLNDLLAEGSISKDEYKKRRAEVMAGGTATGSAARAATSRAVGGVNDKRAKRSRFRIPRPVKALVVLAVLGGAGYAAYAYGWPLIQDRLGPEVVEEADTGPEVVAAPPGDEVATPEPEVVAVAAAPPAILMVTPGVPVEAWVAEAAPAGSAAPADPDEGQGGAGGGGGARDVVRRLAEASQGAVEQASGAASGAAGGAAEVAEREAARVATALSQATGGGDGAASAAGAEAGAPDAVAFWPVMFPEARSSFALAGRSAKSMRMSRSDGEADFGVVLGPAVPGGVEDPAMRRFSFEMRREVLNGLGSEDWRPSGVDDQPRRYGPFDAAIYTEWRGRTAGTQGDIVVLAVAAQQGRAVAYWFSGKSRLLSTFEREAVGTAVLE